MLRGALGHELLVEVGLEVVGVLSVGEPFGDALGAPTLFSLHRIGVNHLERRIRSRGDIETGGAGGSFGHTEAKP